MNVFSDPRVQFLGALAVATGLFVFLVARLLRRQERRLHEKATAGERSLAAEVLHVAVTPLTLGVWIYSLQAAAHVAVLDGWTAERWQWVNPLLENIARVGSFALGLWFALRLTKVLERRMNRVAERTRGRFDDVVLPLVGTGLRVTIPILAAFLLFRLWPVAPEVMAAVNKALGIALVAAIAWLLRRLVVLVDEALLGRKGISGATTVAQRALFTRVRMLRRIALVLITIFTLAAVLMMFEEVRDVGRSILASAGIAGIVLGFAAQRTLGNLFAGIQIAMTQPVRLGDQVIVEGGFASIEEITLTYVIARTWDERRIVLPIAYFIEKPFQNWTRTATSMLAPLLLRVDFSLPVGEFRAFMAKEIEKSPFWDKNVFGVQVTDSDDRSMQVRVLASAPDSGAAWNLRCELREKAIDFIRTNYPHCLPKIRQEQHRVASWDEGITPPPQPRTWTDGDAPLVGPAAAP